jgi:hypothetical protein
MCYEEIKTGLNQTINRSHPEGQAKNLTRSHGSVSIWGFLFDPGPGSEVSACRHRLHRSDPPAWCHFNWHLSHQWAWANSLTVTFFMSMPAIFCQIQSAYANCISVGCVLIFSSQTLRWFYKQSQCRMRHSKILHAFLSSTAPDTGLAYHNILDALSVFFFIVYSMTMPTANTYSSE